MNEPNQAAATSGGDSVDNAAEALFRQIEGPESSDDPDGGNDEAEQSDEGQPQGDAQDDEQGESDGEEQDDEGEQESDEDDPAAAKSKEPDDSMTVKVKVGKEDREITLGDLKKGYMMGSDYTSKTQAVAQAKKQFIEEATQYEQGISARVQEVNFLAQVFEAQLVDVEQTTDWNALRQQNPAEYAARQHDLQQRRALLARAKAANAQAMQQQQALHETRMQQHLAEQSELLTSLVPEWIDGDVASKEKQDIARYLVDFGVPAEEIENLADSRTVAIVRKAMLYDRMTAQKKAAAQKVVKPVPKFTKPGARDPAPAKSIQQKYFDRAKRTKSSDDWANALATKYDRR